MLRQPRALFHSASPLPDHLHYHLDDEGREVLCDESRCRPEPRQPLLYLPRH